jgi:hypothetical protein
MFGDVGELYICNGSNTNGGIPGKFSQTAQQEDSYHSAAILVAHLGKASFNGAITYDGPILGTPITGVGPNGVEVYGMSFGSQFLH